MFGPPYGKLCFTGTPYVRPVVLSIIKDPIFDRKAGNIWIFESAHMLQNLSLFISNRSQLNTTIKKFAQCHLALFLSASKNFINSDIKQHVTHSLMIIISERRTSKELWLAVVVSRDTDSEILQMINGNEGDN